MKKLISTSLLALTLSTGIAYASVYYANDYKASVIVDSKTDIIVHVYNANSVLIASFDGNQLNTVKSDTTNIYIGVTPIDSKSTPMDPHYMSTCYDASLGNKLEVAYPVNFTQSTPPTCPK
jgi:hypothetical protein